MVMTEEQKAAARSALDKPIAELTPRDVLMMVGFLAAATDADLEAVGIPAEIRDL